MGSIELFGRKIGVHKNELQNALTHYSFYEDKNELKGNGRHVFAGMFMFKGQVAEIIEKYISASGTQLQHILGNLFRNDYLNRLFDEWTLKNWVRTSENFALKKHKHIFVYAVFGCIAKLDPEKRRKFIFTYIINHENTYIFNHTNKNKDLIHQAKEIAKMILGEKISTETKITHDGLHTAIVTFNNGVVISEATSKSYRYARKKAIKNALEIISQINFEKYVSESNYLERIQKRIEEEKQRKQLLLEQKLEEKDKHRLQKIEESKRIRKARDLARKKTQTNAKKLKEQREVLLKIKAAKEQKPLSANKRRFLEDKQK